MGRRHVNNFLDVRVEDLSRYKKINRLKIKKLLRKQFNFKIKFKLRPWHHQWVGILLCLMYDGLALFLKPGLGKTAIVLHALRLRAKRGDNVGRILVLVPSDTNVVSWCEEVEAQTSMVATGLHGTTEERIDALKNGDADIYIVSYPALNYICSSLQAVSKKKRQRILDPDMIESLGNFFNTIILDESHMLKNPETLTYRVCSGIADYCDYSYALTGTPQNDVADFYTQLKICDGGIALGDTITLFQSTFFNRKVGYFGGYEYKLKPEMADVLQERIRSCSISYSDEECMDLPPRIDTRVHLNMSRPQIQAYESALEGAIAVATNYIELEASYIRLRQISSGFIDIPDPANPRKRLVERYADTPKLEWLKEHLETNAGQRQIVIFYCYSQSGRMIEHLLKKMKVKHVRLGEGDAYARFKKDPKIEVLLSQVKKGGTGLNLQNAQETVFFEPVDSAILREQAQKRVHRGGQTRTTWIYDLLVNGTNEEHILDATLAGMDFTMKMLSEESLSDVL